ncbi:hypothetical protein [Flavobacterium sp.]|uniref:hypothetical protein n=1 Tax=Flavobacterium sp. TaxID=239 RepID=UPI00286E910E|nr:hypothetical protein [Flavobacterium sp.]
MKYYRLSYPNDVKEIGHNPQVQKTIWDGRPYDEGAFGTQGLFNSFHNNPAIPSIEFYKSAKTTSMISINTIGINLYLIVDKTFLNFLIANCEGIFQTWKIQAKKKDLNYNYYIFFIDNPKYDFINYKESVFRLYIKSNDRKWIKLDKTIKVISDEDCMDKYREYPSIGIEKPFFEAEKLILDGNNCDFFRSSSPTIAGYYVSEKLKNEIEKQGFTGIRFQELNEINNFVEVETI